MIDFNYLFDKYGRPNGIIQIGCQFLLNRNIYFNWGLDNTIWIESNPFFYQINQNLISEKEKILNYSLGVSINSFSINGELQSFEVPIKSLYQIIIDENISYEKYNFIHITLQSGLIDLNSLDDCINNFKYISIEVTKNVDSKVKDYKSVKNYMEKKEFKLKELIWNEDIGHAFFTKKRKYQKNKKK